MTLTVVIVDDQEIARAAIERVVRSATKDVEVVEFSDAPSAYAYIELSPPDLVITDFVMPGDYDGMELLKRLKANQVTSGIPVIVVTGRDDEETRNAALELEAIEYLTKPINATQSKFRIRNVLTIYRNARDLQKVYLEMEQLRKISAEHETTVLLAAQIKAGKAAEAAREAKDLFVAMVSHEFRTPLQSIVSTVETLARRLDALDVPKDELESVLLPMRRLQNDADQLMMQASDLADFVRAEVGRSPHKPRAVNLPLFLDDVIAHHMDAADAKNVKLEASARGMDVVFDLMRLRQIVSNLVGNAVKYTAVGRVLVVLDVVQSADPVRHTLKLEVSDTGVGIPEELLSKVFEPWIRGDIVDGAKGMGLGLSIVQKLITSLKGAIEIESKVGVGTTVRVLLPLTGGQAASADVVTNEARHVSFPYRVLMVDDTEGTRVALREALEDAGAVVSEAAGGAEALSHLSKSTFDVVFLDLQMPGMDGYELAARIRAMTTLKQRALLIAMSAYEKDEARSMNAKGGALFDSFVPKPVTLSSLAQRIEHLMPKQPYSTLRH